MRCIVALLCAFCWVDVTAAQGPSTGSIVVHARDTLGEPLSNVLVTMTEMNSGSARAGYTDRRGVFRFSFLPTGEYQLLAEHLGYRPQRTEAIPARPGREVQMDAVLRREATPGGTVEVLRFDGAALRGGRPGVSQWVTAALIRARAIPKPHVERLSALFSVADDELGIEGLPASLSALAVDGVFFRPARHPLLRNAGLRSTTFSLDGLGSAQLLTSSIDVEWMGAAGGILSTHSQRGGRNAAATMNGSWAGSVIPGQSYVGADAPRFTELRAAAAIRGPALQDSARFNAGVNVVRLRTPVSAAWSSTAVAQSLAQYGEGLGLDLGRYLQSEVVASDAVTGFGHFDWSISSRHQLEGTLQVSSMPERSTRDPAQRLVTRLSGMDMLSSVSVRSAFSGTIANDLRASFTMSSRQSEDTTALPLTRLVSDNLVLGNAAEGRAEEQVVRLSDAVHVHQEAHSLKVGAALELASYRYEHRARGNGEFFFGSIDRLLAGEGALLRIDGPAPIADWTATTPALFAQDRWIVVSGLELLVGVQAELESMPRTQVRRDPEWYRLTGLANDSVAADRWHVSPRLSFTWDVNRDHRWFVHAGAGVFYDRLDPLLLAEWQLDDGSARAVRGVGAVSWPHQTSAPPATSRLTILAPGFEAPHTARVSGGVVYRASEATAIHISAVARRTEGLPRRTDINLLPLPSFRDQYGQAVYGTMAKQGALLAQTPATGRRFREYDEVAGIAADGWSDHRGLTIGVERAGSRSVVAARYTLSSTTDNWFAGRLGGWSVPLPQGLSSGRDWAEAPSDFDVRHRGVLALVADVLPGLQLTGLYRVQSGQPFTPGFRAGVDANADGSPYNDAAFVDADLPGMNELVSRWGCVREAAGRIASRNSCRGDMRHTLDVGAQLTMLRGQSFSAALQLHVANVFASDAREADSALYLITPDADLVTDPVARTVRIPLNVNPNFGEPVSGRHAGRKATLGLSLSW